MKKKIKLPLVTTVGVIFATNLLFQCSVYAADSNTQYNIKKSFPQYTAEQLTSSNDAINRQLSSSSGVTKLTNASETVIVKKVSTESSIAEIATSNLVIQKQLKSYVPKEETASVTTEMVVEYRFPRQQVKLSNLAIEHQLKSNTNPVQHADVASLKNQNPADDGAQAKAKNKIIVRAAVYNFSVEAVALSNLTIEKQLSRYIANIEHTEIATNHEIDIDELEVPEQSETEIFVQNVSDYSNDKVNSNSDADTKTKVSKKSKDYPELKFSAIKVKKSNLAIAKQLRGYKVKITVSKKDKTTTSTEAAKQTVSIEIESESETTSGIDDQQVTEAKVSVEDEHKIEITAESESELLISNSSHEINNTDSLVDAGEVDDAAKEEEDDDDDYSQVSSKVLAKLKESTEKAEDDDDEYGSERIEFKNEPYYFTQSYEQQSNTVTNKNIAVPDIEDIHDNENSQLSDANKVTEIEVIEEIEINDDGKIVTSSSN